MIDLFDSDQTAAGPSSRPYLSPFPTVPSPSQSLQTRQACLLVESGIHNDNDAWVARARLDRRGEKRQDAGMTNSSSVSDSIAQLATDTVGSSSTTTSNGLFAGPTTASSSSVYSGDTLNATATESSETPYTSAAISTYSFSAPWRDSTKSYRPSSPEQTADVPGVLLDLSLSGSRDSEAVYSVAMSFGHGTQDGSASRRKSRRPSQPDWNGGGPQLINLQVDLGSSDLWVASDLCTSEDCESAAQLFNASQSLVSGVSSSLQYHSGEVDGEIYWEQVALGDFEISYQAFLLADIVSSENLEGGNFTGVLGLALPANSIIENNIPGTTTGAPDGATFLDNLFGGGAYAPTQRLFSLALERREDTRTSSSFGIGAVSPKYCPSPCSPPYIPIVAQPSLGTVGFLHWRIPIQGITAMTWEDPKNGGGMSSQNITLGYSQTDLRQSAPLAVLDSGGLAILVGSRTLIDAIYEVYGVSASPDGNYRFPCTTQLALSFTFAAQAFPIHPLDLSWPDPDDPSQATCIGAIQYSSALGNVGDFVLGSAFLKNVYSIFQYPDDNGTIASTWQPTVGMLPLTNASVAAQDFYAVRNLRQSLSSVSAKQQTLSGSDPSSPSSTSAEESVQGHRVVSSTIIASVSVVAFFVAAAAAFCAWWFLRRRKLSATDVAPVASSRRRSPGDPSDANNSTLRSKKHNAAQRQKSMIEGYSDYEGDSWVSTTNGEDSIRLGYIPELSEEEEERKTRLPSRSSRGSSVRETSVDRPKEPDLIDTSDPPVDPEVSPGYPSAYAYPAVAPALPRSLSLSMSGPFPSSNRQSLVRPDASPAYDINARDYFTAGTATGGIRGRESGRGGSIRGDGPIGSRSRGRRDSPHRGRFVDTPLAEAATEGEERDTSRA